MKSPPVACAPFVEAITAFVDGELQPAAGGRLVAHMEACPGCRDLMEELRRLSSLSSSGASEADCELAASLDPGALFGAITRDLLTEQRETLARLFYEIGKAYALVASKALSERRRQSVAACAPPVALRPTEARARRLLREAEDLGSVSPAPPPGTTQLFRRSRHLFGKAPGAESGALRRAGRFLEEALALAPVLDEARLWLGFQHAVAGRPDRARVQLRKVYLSGRRSEHRLMALQSLGRLHAEAGDYRRAIACYREVVASPEATRVPGLLPSFLNLAVNCVKAGLVPEAGEHFAALARQFPDQLTRIRGLLEAKPVFRALLERDEPLRRALAERAPLLFAA